VRRHHARFLQRWIAQVVERALALRHLDIA